MPLMLATGRMVARAPPFGGIGEPSNISDVVSKVKNLEESMEAFMKSQSDQIRELTEIVTVNACQRPSAPMTNLHILKETSNLETPRSKKRRLENENNDARNDLARQPPALHTEEVLDPSQPGHGHAGGARSYAAAAGTRQQVGGITSLSQLQGQTQPRFRKNSILVYGKATTGKSESEEILAADVELVATGVARDASSEQLRDFITAKGIEVLDIEKLTTYEHARTNTFKVKIKAAQYNKAMNPDIWPLRVGVRHFRQPRRDQSNRLSWQDQANKSGGMINQLRTVQDRSNHQNEQQQLRQPQFPYYQNQYHHAQVHHGYQQQLLGQP